MPIRSIQPGYVFDGPDGKRYRVVKELTVEVGPSGGDTDGYYAKVPSTPKVAHHIQRLVETGVTEEGAIDMLLGAILEQGSSWGRHYLDIERDIF